MNLFPIQHNYFEIKNDSIVKYNPKHEDEQRKYKKAMSFSRKKTNQQGIENINADTLEIGSSYLDPNLMAYSKREIQQNYQQRQQ